MSAKPVTIARYMSKSPHLIGQQQTLDEAHRLMREHGVRHLPVLYGGRLVGVVSQRDLALIESLPGVETAKVQVEDAMSTDLYVVGPDTALGDVATHMAERKLGSVVVEEHGKVVGVFTATDALHALVDALAAR